MKKSETSLQVSCYKSSMSSSQK